MFKVRKNISPSAESALITKTEESNRRDENIIVLAKATSHMMQRGVPTAQIVSTASGSGHWTLSGCVGGETRLAGFWRQVHKTSAFQKQVNNWIKGELLEKPRSQQLGGDSCVPPFHWTFAPQECRWLLLFPWNNKSDLTTPNHKSIFPAVKFCAILH